MTAFSADFDKLQAAPFFHSGLSEKYSERMKYDVHFNFKTMNSPCIAKTPVYLPRLSPPFQGLAANVSLGLYRIGTEREF